MAYEAHSPPSPCSMSHRVQDSSRVLLLAPTNLQGYSSGDNGSMHVQARGGSMSSHPYEAQASSNHMSHEATSLPSLSPHQPVTAAAFWRLALNPKPF